MKNTTTTTALDNLDFTIKSLVLHSCDYTAHDTQSGQTWAPGQIVLIAEDGSAELQFDFCAAAEHEAGLPVSEISFEIDRDVPAEEQGVTYRGPRVSDIDDEDDLQAFASSLVDAFEPLWIPAVRAKLQSL